MWKFSVRIDCKDSIDEGQEEDHRKLHISIVVLVFLLLFVLRRHTMRPPAKEVTAKRKKNASGPHPNQTKKATHSNNAIIVHFLLSASGNTKLLGP
jgi:hypothetical protein